MDHGGRRVEKGKRVLSAESFTLRCFGGKGEEGVGSEINLRKSL